MRACSLLHPASSPLSSKVPAKQEIPADDNCHRSQTKDCTPSVKTKPNEPAKTTVKQRIDRDGHSRNRETPLLWISDEKYPTGPYREKHAIEPIRRHDRMDEGWIPAQEQPIDDKPQSRHGNTQSDCQGYKAALTHGSTHHFPGRPPKYGRGPGEIGVVIPASPSTERTKFVQLFPPNVYVPGLAFIFLMELIGLPPT